MVNHVVMWNFKEGLSEAERKEAYENLKAGLEEVKGQADGVLALNLVYNELSSSNRDIALFSSFESVEALNAYQVHPVHVKAAEEFKKAATDRACLDYEA